MRLDVFIDDEFEAGEADAIVRQVRRRKGQVRVAEIQHDLRLRLGQPREVGFGDLELEFTLVHAALVTGGAGHGHGIAVWHRAGRGVAAHDGGHSEFARDDRGVTGAAAAVGHDRGGGFHDRFPVGRGRVGDEHFTGPEFVQMGDIAYVPRAAGRNLGA